MKVGRYFSSIRARLLLVSLLLLLIPLIGLRFVRQMEGFLLEGQRQVLTSAAKLLSATLSDRPALFPREPQVNSVEEEERRRVLGLFVSADPETAAGLGAAYLPSDDIERKLDVVARDTARIWVVDTRLRVRGLSGTIDAPEPAAPRGLMHATFRSVLRPVLNWLAKDPGCGVVSNRQEAARAVMSQVDRAINGQPTEPCRYVSELSTFVLSAAQPIWVGDQIVGAVVVEESTRGTQAIKFAALESLLATSVIVCLICFVVLVAFAWRLAIRVRRLQTEADRAIDAHGRVTGVISASADPDEIGSLARTLEQMLSRLSRYNAYLEQMASRLAHELRTPVAVVRSSLDNLRHATLPVAERVYIERADEGVRRLAALIARMSEASQLERMLQGMEKERFDIASVVSGCVEGYRLAYPETRFELDLVVGQRILLDGLPDAIAQLLDKLVQNAVDFADPAHPVVIRIGRSDASALLAVENHGPLLDAETAATLFTSMVSSRAVSGAQEGHLGLGLYIVRLITDFHGGIARAMNRADGSGVRFEVLLPMA